MAEEEEDKQPTYKTKTITPKALQVYDEMGLLDFDESGNLTKKLIEVYKDTDKLERLLKISFKKDFSDTELEKINLEVVDRSVLNFLGQLLNT